MATLPDVVAPDLLRAEYRRPWFDDFIVSILLIAVGGGLIWLGARQSRPDQVEIVGGAALALLFLGVAIYTLVYQRDRRLQLFAHGLLDRRPLNSRLYPWDAIAQVSSQ